MFPSNTFVCVSGISRDFAHLPNMESTASTSASVTMPERTGSSAASEAPITANTAIVPYSVPEQLTPPIAFGEMALQQAPQGTEAGNGNTISLEDIPIDETFILEAFSEGERATSEPAPQETEDIVRIAGVNVVTEGTHVTPSVSATATTNEPVQPR